MSQTVIVVNPDNYWTTLNDPTLNNVEVQFDTGLYANPIDKPENGIWLPGPTYAGPVTLTPKPGANVQIACIQLNGKVTLTGFNIAMKPTTQYGVTAAAPGTVISNNKIGQEDGKTFAGTAVWLRNTHDITVTDNEICFVGDGIDSLDCQNIDINHNNLHDIASNATFHSSFKGLKVRNNTITNMRIQPDSSHPDAIQWASTGDTGRSSNLEVTGNVITRGAGDAVQGIFGESTDNIFISTNAMQGTMLNGISVSDSTEIQIINNFGQGLPDQGIRILVRGASQDVLVKDNVFGTWGEYNDGTPNVNVQFVDNTLIDNATSPTDLGAMQDWLVQHGSVVPPPVIVPPTVDPLQTQVDQLTAQVKTLSSQVAALETQNTTLTTQNATLTTRVATDKTQITKLQTKINNAIAALNAP